MRGHAVRPGGNRFAKFSGRVHKAPGFNGGPAAREMDAFAFD
jgi:hypothetical protein